MYGICREGELLAFGSGAGVLLGGAMRTRFKTRGKLINL